MLESVVARLLNQLLGKYIVDLDTENLNVGIFSGQVQLKDLQLKVEALYELKLPIKVKVGTIGKIWLKIPWNYLWNDPIIVNIEDIHIIAEPIVSFDEYNPETDKRLTRALKKKLLSELETEREFIGGPKLFPEHLLTNIINHLQLNITNVHIRYEDNLSLDTPIACGLCIGSITAETTNSKWKASKLAKNAETCYYLVKIEALSSYWNTNYKEKKWDIPSQYYLWRNAMSSSLENYNMNDEDFKFIIKPMTTKVKMTINRTEGGDIAKILSDIIVQDCNFQLSQTQYHSMLALHDSLKKMLISWKFLHFRPRQTISKNKKIWWKYAYHGVLEQRVKPYTWSRIKKVRQEYRQYLNGYKKFLLNPNDTELKLDLQKYEDCLSIVNIVIARRQANLLVKESSFGEKSFWTMLPSPERTELCKRIGFTQEIQDVKQFIEHKYSFRMGNVSLSLTRDEREILVVTLTQVIWSILPNFRDDSYKAAFKIEGIVVEGASVEDHLLPIISSEHNFDSPAYFLKLEIEKMPSKSNLSHRVNGTLSTVEIVYQQYAYEEVKNYFKNELYSLDIAYKYLQQLPGTLFNIMDDKISKRWSFNLDITVPYLVLSETGKMLKGENILILDFGHVTLKTELCEKSDVSDTTTQMELEEQFYSRLHIDVTDTQILFGAIGESWKDAKKEKNTDMHVMSKTNISATFASCVKTIKTIPRYKFNTNVPSLKLNISERKIVSLLKFCNTFFNNNATPIKTPSNMTVNLLKKIRQDKTVILYNSAYLRRVHDGVRISGGRVRIRKRKTEKNGIVAKDKRRYEESRRRENMNEAWARVVDLPGLEDNISPNNSISTLLRLVISEFSLTFSRSSDITDRAYLVFRLGSLMMDVALMTYGPACQVSLNSIVITDKLYTNSSGQYLDLVYSIFPSKVDVLTILYRKVDANCPDFWTHFHGVETSLVSNVGTMNLLLHQEALHTIIKYTRYMYHKIQSHTSQGLKDLIKNSLISISKIYQCSKPETPVPPGAVKFSHSAHLENLKVRVCDSDFDIINAEFTNLEMDFLFRANERFVFRSYLSTLTVEHLSDGTLYSKVISTDEDKVFEIKYVRHAPHLIQKNDISPRYEDVTTDGSFKFQLGRIHVTFLYKLVVQLQRFIVNLEALPYIQKTIKILREALTEATDTLKASTKIHLAINIHGPILLFPQRSDSPNVVIFDTGELNVENYFKECPYELIENILVKLNSITISRGVMSLTSNLEMQFQETIIEPLSVHLDVKRFISYTKSAQKPLSWDIDGVVDAIQITLGQRDLSVILAIYVDNIGEGKLMDLIPETVKSPTVNCEVDNTVKSLEAFFCEPKQRDILVKLSLDSINLILFFDSAELLSSPIRDLNHGLCKFEICDILMSSIIYTDLSLDGKLSVDCVLVEELGLNVNSYDKGILHSPIDNNRSNNCNITVNKPPIIDITFHQNKTGDKSIDVIIGRLSLCLSVPFCEKFALFVLECLPKENIDLGIINHGYIADSGENMEPSPNSTSITVAVRVNKPEFIFNVETTSNKKRYFITKSEILSDYSRHNNRLNLAISLSGFHTLFYDLGINASTPYVVLKRCDVEFSKSFTDEKGDKITTNVSSICVQLCSRVVHSMNDILNDIAEHFKVPEVITDKIEAKLSGEKSEPVDFWEPKKICQHAFEIEDEYDKTKVVANEKLHEIFLVPKTEIVVVLELEEIPVIIIKSTVELTVYNWSSLLNSTCEMTIQANYYNEGLQIWEPIIDPVVINENEYVSWDILIKVFQDKALPILNTTEAKPKKDHKFRKKSPSISSTEDEESKEDMVYLEPPKSLYNLNSRGIKTSLSTFLDESDSENEDGAMEKLASAISDLFTGDWNESDGSDYEHSSEADEESDENLDTKIEDEQSSTVDVNKNFKKSTFFLFEAKETLNFTITPAFLRVANEIVTLYSSKTLSIITNRNAINLINDVGPKSVVELYENKGGDDSNNAVLIHSKTFENEDSCPNSPSKIIYMNSEYDEANDDVDSLTDELNKLDEELSYDYDITDSLQFPNMTTSALYDKNKKHHLKIHVPGFVPLQSNCAKKTWEKLMRLQSTAVGQTYYLLTKHCIGKHGRSVTVGSPLQIRNETCFALNILYQPSVLQQLNLEPVGDVTNPFETTMRIAVLEPHDHYNVPLYIAYHCKLFIQPAHAEGYHVSEEGLWWKDLAKEMDVPHHITCKPKHNINLEMFALKVLLKRNIRLKNSTSYSIPNFIIHLIPPYTLQNFLPYTLELQNTDLKQQIKIEPGEKSSLYSVSLSNDNKFSLKVTYSNLIWTGTLNLTRDIDEKIVILYTDDQVKANKQLPINVKAERENNYNILFYASYWIVNKTELPLQIKTTTGNTIYESVNEDVLLFAFKRHAKQSVTLKVYESSWSNDFGLDCAGTTGLVVCKDHERKKRYSFLLSIRLSKLCPHYSKIVTFLPSFVVVNNTKKFLRFMEHNEKTDLWTDLPPHQYKIFWPETPSMEMYVKYRDSKLTSQAFFIATPHHTVLRMDKGSALSVEVTGGSNEPFKIEINEYKAGDAPILVKNMCADLFLKIQQNAQSQVTLLNPFTSLIYTWDDPTKPRQLLWNVYNNKGSGFFIDIFKDGFGEEKINFHSVPSTTPNTIKNSEDSSTSEDSDTLDSVKTTLNRKVRRDKIVIYWICHNEGLQKVLVFTQDQRTYNLLMKNTFNKLCTYEFLCSLSGIGISVFNETSNKELAYVSISDSPAIWEVNVGHKWKTLTLELASWIENKYKLHYKKCQLKDYIHIDFEKMFMLKPFFAELRRSYNSALYFLYRKSRNYDYFSLKIQNLQVDSKQSINNESSILFQALPPVNIKSPSSLIEMIAFKHSFNDCHVYKTIRVNFEEFQLHFDLDFIQNITEMVANSLKFKEDLVSMYRSEMTLVHTPIAAISKDTSGCKTKIEDFRLSQISVQLSVSSRNRSEFKRNKLFLNKLLNYIFPISSSPYMPAEGVKHKTTPLELTQVKCYLGHLGFNVFRSTISNFLQQYYSQVLGLQVLVNSYSVLPIPCNEHALSESELMANYMLSGYRCMLGHLNMSPAALEQCATEIFSNQSIETIQRIRRHGSYHNTTSVPRSITASSKNFETGVTLALNQLITKNSHNGMHYDGEIFFRGTGKALFSLITRHPDDKSDIVQIAVEALRRASMLGEPVRIHQRLTRYFNSYLGIRPFSMYESMGHHLLETVSNNKFIEDTYWAHTATDKIGKSIVIITLEHIIKVIKCRLWGTWDLEWALELDEIISVPQIETSEIVLNVRQEENRFGSSPRKISITGNKEMLLWLKEKIEQAIVVSMEDKSWAVNE